MAALLLVSHIYPQIIIRGECDTFMRHIGHDLLASGSWIFWATAFQANRKSIPEKKSRLKADFIEQKWLIRISGN